jgi:sugar lactone lactonase YvrE
VWDDRRRRLYFVDCASWQLCWLDGDDDTPIRWKMPSMLTGVVPANDGRTVVVLEDGLYVVDPETRVIELLSAYPEQLEGRCNDACADLDDNFITGKLNLGPAEGSAWTYSIASGWRLLDDDISNTNGPNALVLNDVMTLIIGDTAADYYACFYDPSDQTAGTRRVFGDMTTLAGHPDGATVDSAGGLWCALFAGSQLARFTTRGLDRTLALPVTNPTDVTFGGADLDRLYVTSISAPAANESTLDGALLVMDRLDITGRVEPRFALA